VLRLGGLRGDLSKGLVGHDVDLPSQPRSLADPVPTLPLGRDRLRPEREGAETPEQGSGAGAQRHDALRVEGPRCEIDRDEHGYVGSRKYVASHERRFRQPRVEIGVEIRDVLPAAVDQGGDLFVVVRPCYRAAALRTPSMTAAKPSSSTRRSHMTTSALPTGPVPRRGRSRYASSE